MKFFIASGLLAMSLTSLAAATNPQDCMKQKKALDRRYCMDTYLETVKDSYDAERSAMANGLADKTRAEKISAAEQDIAAKKDYMNLLKTELELQEKYLEEVKAAKVSSAAAPAPAPAKKKKKKDKGFKIKL
jgi:hypothetical protein